MLSCATPVAHAQWPADLAGAVASCVKPPQLLSAVLPFLRGSSPEHRLGSMQLALLLLAECCRKGGRGGGILGEATAIFDAWAMHAEPGGGGGADGSGSSWMQELSSAPRLSPLVTCIRHEAFGRLCQIILEGSGSTGSEAGGSSMLRLLKGTKRASAPSRAFVPGLILH